jgi:NNP family nitrate/nitrite transporter-like MFS transporter
MTDTSFWKSGHRPTLIMAFLYFDVAFMVWNLLGRWRRSFPRRWACRPPKGLCRRRADAGGAVLRLVNGFLADRIGQKTTGIISQTIVILGLLTIWHFGVETMNGLIALGMVLGFAGAAFPWRCRWRALVSARASGQGDGHCRHGQFGHGLCRAVRAAAGQAFGWTNVLALATIPAVLVLAAFVIWPRTAPTSPRPSRWALTWRAISRCCARPMPGGSSCSTA